MACPQATRETGASPSSECGSPEARRGFSATKFANHGFARALNRECRAQGLKVATLCPSAANTMFDIGRARTVEGNNDSPMLLPEDIADAVVFTCWQSKRACRVTEMSLASMAGN